MCMSFNVQDVVHKLSELLASYSQVLHDNASSTASGSASTAASSLAHSSASTAAAASDSASRLGAQQPAATEHADRLQPQQGRLQAFVHGFQRDKSDLSGDGYSGVGLLHHVPTVLQPMILSSLLPSLSGHHTFSEGVFLDCASWFIQTAENMCSGNTPDEPSAALLYIPPYLDMMRKSCSALFGNQRGRPLLLPSPNTYTASKFQHVAGHVSVSIVFVLHMPPLYAHGYYTCHACFACKGKFQSCCTVTSVSSMWPELLTKPSPCASDYPRNLSNYTLCSAFSSQLGLLDHDLYMSIHSLVAAEWLLQSSTMQCAVYFKDTSGGISSSSGHRSYLHYKLMVYSKIYFR